MQPVLHLRVVWLGRCQGRGPRKGSWQRREDMLWQTLLCWCAFGAVRNAGTPVKEVASIGTWDRGDAMYVGKCK